MFAYILESSILKQIHKMKFLSTQIFYKQISMKKFNRIVIDPFCQRQFNKDTVGFIDFDMKEFQVRANDLYQKADLVDGYAPFCKHVFIQNFPNIQRSVVQINPDIQKNLYTVYEARTQKQLPVLRRYIPKEKVQLGTAKYLDLILYTKQQVQKQNQAMGNVDPNKDLDYDFGIVSVKPQDVPHQTPMDPITMMRNALGKQEGGSGVKLQKQKYLESVQFWKKHAIVK